MGTGGSVGYSYRTDGILPGVPVMVASMGNHAQAVAYAASRLGKRAFTVMPETAAIVKQRATQGYGAEVILRGERLNDALAHALSRSDALFIHPFDDDAVIAGLGALGADLPPEGLPPPR